MDRLHNILIKAISDPKIIISIDGVSCAVKRHEGTFIFNHPECATIYRLIDFEAIEETEDGYILFHEDEDMPFELTFSLALSLNDIENR